MTGTQIGPYRILEKLGQGGMGEVYKAEDTRLKRLVAIKVMREGRHAGEQERLRFLQEARAASALNHPNIVQIYGLESIAGADCIVMEYAPGRTLAEVLEAGALSVAQALGYARQIAAALSAAHAAKIVHRDIKPANILVTETGAVKVLDFGLAKPTSEVQAGESTITAGPLTEAHAVVGTAPYMSPEQAEGKPVNASSDVFSAGATFYEMFSGKRAFPGDSTIHILSKVLRESPPPLRLLRAEIPKEVEEIVSRCMAKDAQARYASGQELALALGGLERANAPGRRTMALAAAGLAAAIALSGWFYYRYSRIHWTRAEALPRIRSLIEKNDFAAAFDLTQTAIGYSPDDPDLKHHWNEVSTPASMTTTPPGAKIFYRAYGETGRPWKTAGTTPFENVPMPWAHLTLRIEKPGYEPLEITAHGLMEKGTDVPLVPAGQLPDGMVSVHERTPWIGPLAGMPLPAYYIDKYEVTNRQFKKFVDEGGYRTAKHWQERFVKGGRVLGFEEAIPEFRDRTGRPGPAGWELGAFPKDQSEFPVSGVSWYEAGAYCQSVGKVLPTLHHWRRAAGFGLFSEILLHSNFSNAGPSRVGSTSGITPFGVYDMAGNVKEWTSSAAGERRVILGGGWNETSYLFRDVDAQDPFARGVSYGFRCAKYLSPPPEAAFAPRRQDHRDYSKEQPVDDKAFESLRKMYAYDKTPLDAKVEYRDDSREFCSKVKVNFRTVYGERMAGYLFLPKNGKPPYQTAIWAPGGYAPMLRSSETGIRTEEFDFLLKTGRAIFCPVYKGTYERRLADDAGPVAQREAFYQYIKDVFQSVDFLESRPEIDRNRLAFCGLSAGAYRGVFALALETRLKAGILYSIGLAAGRPRPEVDPFQFAPRVSLPVLMVNGEYDFIFPVEESQKPLFRALGTPERDKRHSLFDSGHVPPLQAVMRETLDWLDRYLGPVETK